MRKRSLWEILCILGLPQGLSAMFIGVVIAHTWCQRFVRNPDLIDELKTVFIFAIIFWINVMIKNLLWLRYEKKIGFFTWMDKFRYEPQKTTMRKHKAQYPDIPKEFLSDQPDGLVLGRKGKRYVRVKLEKGNILNAVILGSAGCGKSVLLLTTLLFQLNHDRLQGHSKNGESQEAMTFFVTDIKPELARKSVIIKDNPHVHYMDVLNRTCYGWDVYYKLTPASTDDEVLSELNVIARALIDEGKSDKNAFFYEHARTIFKAILLWTFRQGMSFMQGMDYLMTGSLESVISKTIEHTKDKQEYKLIYKLLSPFVNKEGEAFEGIELSLRQQLDIFNQQTIKYFLETNTQKASPFDLENRISVFFGIKESKLEEYRSLLRLVTMQVKEHCIDRPENSHMLTFIIDEAARIGVDWTSFMATSRSRQINTVLAFQSLSQAEDVWGKEKSKTLIELCRVIAVLSCTDPDMAKVLGEWSGDYSEEKQTYNNSGKNAGNSSYSFEDKRVLTQADIMRLQENKEILAFVKGQYLRMDVDGARYYNIPTLNGISQKCITENEKPFN